MYSQPWHRVAPSQLNARDHTASHSDEPQELGYGVVLDEEILSHVADGIQSWATQTEQVTQQRVGPCVEGVFGINVSVSKVHKVSMGQHFQCQQLCEPIPKLIECFR